MRLELTGRHVDITPVLRRLVDRKLAKLERLLDHRALSAQVVLRQDKRLSRVDLTIHARGEKFLHAVGEAASWGEALTQAAEKIEQQAQRVKGRLQSRKRQRRGTPTEPAAPEIAPEEPASTRRSAATPVRMPRVLRTMRQPVRSLSIADAARRLDGSDEGVLVFRDDETNGLSVLYRSASGELILVVTAS